MSWELQWWAIDVSERPIPVVSPKVVCVEAMEGPSLSIWPPQPSKRTRRMRTGTWTSTHQPDPRTSASSAASAPSSSAVAIAEPEHENVHDWGDVAADELLDGDDDDDAEQDMIFPDEENDDHATNLLARAAELDTCDADTLLVELSSANAAGGLPSHVPDADTMIHEAAVAAVAEPDPGQGDDLRIAGSSVAVPHAGASNEPVSEPAVAARQRPLRLNIGVAEAVVEMVEGRISYYAGKSGFEAVCRNPAHGPGRCVLFRTAKLSKSGGRPTRGRPLGFLMCWLRNNHVPTKALHHASENMQFSHESRCKCREELSGQRLLGFERARLEGEDAEPLTLQGYV